MEKEKKKQSKILGIFTAIGGLIWCVVFILAGIMFFMQGNFLSNELFGKTGMTESPHFMGGEIIQTFTKDQFVVQTHEIVREGLRKKGRRGFIQVDWKYRNIEIPVENFLVYYPGYDEALAEISIDPEKEEIQFRAIHPDVLGLMNLPTMAGWGYLVTTKGKKALLKNEDGVSVRIVIKQKR